MRDGISANQRQYRPTSASVVRTERRRRRGDKTNGELTFSKWCVTCISRLGMSLSIILFIINFFEGLPPTTTNERRALSAHGPPHSDETLPLTVRLMASLLERMNIQPSDSGPVRSKTPRASSAPYVRASPRSDPFSELPYLTTEPR